MAWPQPSLADYASADPLTLAVAVGVAVVAGLIPVATWALIAIGLRVLWRLARAIGNKPAPRGP